ncbi:MAG: DUF4845 domain-containing protein [Burkholderiales bacterium]
MRARQRGVTLMGLLFVSFIIVIIALLGMRLAPSYIEYYTIKKAVTGVASETRGRGATISDVRRLFDNRQAIDDFKSVSAADLEITKDGNDYALSASWRREVPLFSNIGIYIDFVASSRSGGL